ncbi:MAG: Crp/Fnr family transcriptional regulator [Candidatus Levyibacteriota bacterium]
MKKVLSTKISDFFKHYEKTSYVRGAYLKNPGKKPKGVFLLASGTVRCFSFSKEGSELTINMFRPISFFPVGWAINNFSDPYAYEALTDVEVYMAPRDKFEAFLKKNPDVTYDLLRRIFRGLEGYFMRIESLLSGEPYFRTIVELVIHTRRFGAKSGKAFHVDLTHAKIASMAGLSRETVTREIKKLEEQGIVKYEGKKLILQDIETLEAQLLG